MRTEKFASLAQHPWGFTDLGSALEFFSTESLLFLTGNDSQFGGLRKEWKSRIAEQGPGFLVTIWPHVLRALSPYTASLNLLEQLIVHECLVLDQRLVNLWSIKQGKVDDFRRLLDSPFFVLSDVPEEVRREAADQITRNRSAFLIAKTDAWYGPDDRGHDMLFSEPDIYRRYCFADSGDTAERAYFYLMISRESGLPLVVSPAKLEFLDALWSDTKANIHKLLVEKAMTHDISQCEQQITEALAPLSPPLPPVAEMIVVRSLTENLSPLDACQAIREMTETQQYRSFIKDLLADFRGPLGNRLSAQQKIQEIESLMADWRIDPYEAVKYKKCYLNLKKIPKVGWLAELIDFKPIKLPNWLGTILNPPEPHLIFMSRWFRKPEGMIEVT